MVDGVAGLMLAEGAMVTDTGLLCCIHPADVIMTVYIPDSLTPNEDDDPSIGEPLRRHWYAYPDPTLACNVTPPVAQVGFEPAVKFAAGRKETGTGLLIREHPEGKVICTLYWPAVFAIKVFPPPPAGEPLRNH
jgi:hypothetical protein